MPRRPRINLLVLVGRRACARWKPAACVFGLCFTFALVVAFILPNTYQSSMKVSVGNVADAGVEPRLSPGIPPAEDPLDPIQRDIRQLTNDDILRQVVLQSHLARPAAATDLAALRRQEAAVRRLQSELTVSAFQGPDIIELTYRSTDADRAADVLRNLAGAYANTFRVTPLQTPSSARLAGMSAINRARLAAARTELARFKRTRPREISALTLDQADRKLTEAQVAAHRALLRRVADLQGLDRTFSSQIQQARLVERIDAQNLSALGAMQPTQPVLVSSPPRALIGLVGFLAASLLAAATALALELLADRLHSKSSVEQAIGLPVLASIPPNAVAPAFQNAFPALYLAMQRPVTVFEGKLS